MQMFGYYFPDKALNPAKRPTFWPHDDESQPDLTKLPYLNTWTDKKNLMTHEDWEELWRKKVSAGVWDHGGTVKLSFFKKKKMYSTTNSETSILEEICL